MPWSNGINVLWVTGKRWGPPGTANGGTGSGACGPGAQAGLSYPEERALTLTLKNFETLCAERPVCMHGPSRCRDGLRCAAAACCRRGSAQEARLVMLVALDCLTMFLGFGSFCLSVHCSSMISFIIQECIDHQQMIRNIVSRWQMQLYKHAP